MGALCACSSLSDLRCLAHSVAELLEDRAHLLDRPLDLVLAYHQRRREAHDRAVGVLRQQAASEQPVDDRSCVGAPMINLDADEQSLASYFANERTANGLQLREQ